MAERCSGTSCSSFSYTMHACSMAMDVLGWEESDLKEGLFDGSMGLTKFLSDAETGQLITL